MAATQQNVPALRFPEFNEAWIAEKLGNCLERVIDPVEVEFETQYREIGVRSHGGGIFHKKPVSGKSLGNKRVFRVYPNSLILNIVFAWEQAISLTSDNENGFIASHRFPMYVSVNNKVNLKFIFLFFLRKRGKFLLGLASPGGAGRNKTLGQNEFAKLRVTLPSFSEQQKIAAFLSSVDTKIEQLNKKKSLLEQYKKGMMQKLFSQEIRFKDEHGNNFSSWESKRLSDLVVISKGKALCDHRAYQRYPVIAGGKTSPYKSSTFTHENAITISASGAYAGYVSYHPYKFWASDCSVVTAKGRSCTLLFYHCLKCLQNKIYSLQSGGALPHVYPKDLRNLTVTLPRSLIEQQKIADLLSAIERKIELVAKQVQCVQTFKKGLLQQMFV